MCKGHSASSDKHPCHAFPTYKTYACYHSYTSEEAGSHEPARKGTKTCQTLPAPQRPLNHPFQLTESKYSLSPATSLPITSFS